MGLKYKIHYKKGINNGAADALSRKPPASSQIFVATVVQPVWQTNVLQSYINDDHARELLQQLALDSTSNPAYTLHQGILRHKGRILVGKDTTLQQQLIAA